MAKRDQVRRAGFINFGIESTVPGGTRNELRPRKSTKGHWTVPEPEQYRERDQSERVKLRMRRKTTNLPDGWNPADIKRIRDFVKQSAGIAQLEGARLHAICMLWNLSDCKAPKLEPRDVDAVLRTSDLYLPPCRPEDSVQRRISAAA